MCARPRRIWAGIVPLRDLGGHRLISRSGGHRCSPGKDPRRSAGHHQRSGSDQAPGGIERRWRPSRTHRSLHGHRRDLRRLQSHRRQRGGRTGTDRQRCRRRHHQREAARRPGLGQSPHARRRPGSGPTRACYRSPIAAELPPTSISPPRPRSTKSSRPSTAAGIGITADFNSSRTGLVLTDTTGSTSGNLIVASGDATGTAEKLQLAANAAQDQIDSGDLHRQVVSFGTLLSSYNARQGRGPRLVPDQEFQWPERRHQPDAAPCQDRRRCDHGHQRSGHRRRGQNQRRRRRHRPDRYGRRQRAIDRDRCRQQQVRRRPASRWGRARRPPSTARPPPK